MNPNPETEMKTTKTVIAEAAKAIKMAKAILRSRKPLVAGPCVRMAKALVAPGPRVVGPA